MHCSYEAEDTPVAVYLNLHTMLRQSRLDAAVSTPFIDSTFSLLMRLHCSYEAEDTPVAVYLNLHTMLRQSRLDAQQEQQQPEAPGTTQDGQRQPPFKVR